MKTLSHVIVISIFLLALCSAHVMAQTVRYVKPDGVCGGNTPCYTSIQAAISASSAGDEIDVNAGTYTLSGTITIDRDIHIYGANYGVNGQSLSRTSPSTLSYSGGYCFELASGVDAEIDGFDYSGVGFLRSYGDSLYVRNCNFTWTSVWGENDIYLNAAFQYFVFENNNVILTGDVGAALQPIGNYTGSGTASKVLIKGNYFENTGMPTYSEPINLSSCQGEVSNNVIVAVENGVMVADNCGNLAITGNTFTDIADGYDTDYLSGIKLYVAPLSGTISITNNFFDGCDYGVNTSGSEDFSAYTVDIHQNSFASTGFLALRNFATGTFSADCNWFGSADAEDVEALVSGDITYLPWLVDGTDGETGTPGFQPQTACLAPCALVLSASSVPVSCPSMSDGTASVSVTGGGTGTYTYLWSSGAQTTATATGLDVGTYTVTVTDLNGCSALDSAAVSVNPLPTAAVSGGGTVCAGSSLPAVSFALTGSSPWTLTYAINGTDQTPVTGITSSPYTIAHATAGTYTATDLTDLHCTATSLTGSAVVIVNPKPTVVVSGGGTVCVGSTLPNVTFTLTGTGPWSLTYAINNVNQTPVTGISTSPYIITEASAGTYTAKALSDINCTGTSLTGSATVVVNVYPSLTITPMDSTICSGGKTNIRMLSNLLLTSWSYSISVTGGTVSGASGSTYATINQTIVNTGTTTALVTYNVAATRFNCTSYASPTVHVNPKPNGSATPSSFAICSGATTAIALDTGTITGTTFTWTYALGANTSGADVCTSGCGTSLSQTLYNSGTMNSNITYSITPWANGCAGSVIKDIVTVKPKPIAATTTGVYDYSVCNNIKTNILLKSSTYGTSFSYGSSMPTPPDGGDITGDTSGAGNKIQQLLKNTGTSPGTVVYTITPTYLTCVGDDIEVNVTVNPVATGFATTTADTMASGAATSISLDYSLVDNTIFTWSLTKANANISGASACGDTSSSPGCGNSIEQTLTNIANPPSNQTQSYTINPWANGCKGTPFSHTVLVRPIPKANFNNYKACNGSKTKIPLTGSPAGCTFNYTSSVYVSPSGGGTITGYNGKTNATGYITDTLYNDGESEGKIVYEITPVYFGVSGATYYDTVTVVPVAKGSATPSLIGICGNDSTRITLESTVPGLDTYFTWTVNRNNNISNVSACAGLTCGTYINDAPSINPHSSSLVLTYNISPWTNGCRGTIFSRNVTVQSALAPATPIIFAGQSAGICPDPEAYSFTVTNLGSFNTVTWELPAGCTYPGQTLNSNPLFVSFPSGFDTGSVKATAYNLCGTPSVRKSMLVSTSGKFVINGSKTGVCGMTNVNYSVANYPGHSYVWSASTGISITAGGSTPSMTAGFSGSFTSGTITCTVSGCGNPDEVVVATVSGVPNKPVTLTGPTSHCEDSGPHTYYTKTVFGATSYVWTLPGGGVETGEAVASSYTTSDTSISVTYTSSVSGVVSVKAVSCGGQSAAKTLSVAVTCRKAGAPDGVTTGNVAIYPNPAHDKLNVIFNSLSASDYAIRLIDITGRTVMSRVNTVMEGTNVIELDMTSYTKGIYMIILSNGEREQRERIVIE